MIVPPPLNSQRRAEAQPVGRAATIVASFRYAFVGLWYLVRSQRNAQIHLFLGAIAVALGLVVGLARWEWLTLLLTCALVLVAEGVNTALEAAVDLASPGYHPLAKRAKDVAAGTVLLAAVFAVLVGLLLFVPHLWPIALWLFGI